MPLKDPYLKVSVDKMSGLKSILSFGQLRKSVKKADTKQLTMSEAYP